jgi:outer membrane protein TolC
MSRFAPRLLLLLLGLLMCTSVATAAEPLGLTDFLSRYLVTDKSLAASVLRVEASKKVMRAKTGLPAPSLRFDLASPYYSWRRSYSYRYYLNDIYRGFLEARDRSYRLALTLKQRLPTGGDLSVTGAAHRDRTTFSYSGFPSEIPLELETGNRQFMTDVGVALDQPLLGFWERRNEAKRARLEHEAEVAQNRLDSAAALRRAINVYFDYLIGVHNSEAEGIKLARARREAGRAVGDFDEGIIPEADLLARQIEANNAQISYEQARIAVEIATRELRVITPSSAADLKPEDLTAVLPLDTLRAQAPVSPEVLKARREVEIARISLAQTQRRRFGQTTVSLWYGLQGLGDDFIESRDGFANNRWGGSLSIGFALPEPGLSSDIELARANLRLAESSHEEAVQKVSRDKDLLAQRIVSLKSNLGFQARRVVLLEKLVIARKDQFAQDVVSDGDVFDAEIDLLEATMSHLETMRNLALAWLDLAVNCGEDPVELILEGK